MPYDVPKLVRTLSILVTLPLSFLLLAACGAVGPTLPDAGPDEASARTALMSAVGDAFAADAEDDGVDLAAAPGIAGQSVEPFLAIRRRDMARNAEMITITIDPGATPPTAVAELDVAITGRAELYEVYPDHAAPVTLVGEKPIHMTGTITLEAEFVAGAWHLTGASTTAFQQGDYAADIVEWAIDPDPLVRGSDAHVVTVLLDEVETEDEHLVIGRGRHFRPRTVLNDNGADPDPVADDDSYTGHLQVHDDARPGRHLGFLHALNYDRTVDLSAGDDGYLHAYTDTLLPVVVRVSAAD